MAREYELDDAALQAALTFHAAGGFPICGVDEAGRGALAGPVVAAAVLFLGAPLAGLADSKVLSKSRREALFEELQDVAVIGVGIVLPGVIDSVNILQANFIAMQKAIGSVVEQHGSAVGMVLVDGNYLTDEIRGQCNGFGIAIGTVVKGDAKVAEISAASIIAKVTRDRIMTSADAANPGYGFAINSGYPSPAHLASLKSLGACALHRKTFGPVADALRIAAELRASSVATSPHYERFPVRRHP